MEKTYQNLVLAKYKYDAAIAKIENTLRNKVKFEFAVLFQQSDGFVILHTEETRNVSGLCVVALSRNLKLTTTLDGAITQNPCYVPLN